MASFLAKVSGLVGPRQRREGQTSKEEPQPSYYDRSDATLERHCRNDKGKGDAVCSVPGCSQAPPQKVYYQRHRICLYHSNLPALVQQGKTLRWCQQCGRFQGLDEFDGDRKTCRAVLERHNARRRKRTAEQAGARKAGTPPVPPSTTSSSGTKRASPASTSSRKAATRAAAAAPVSDSSQDNGLGEGSELGGLSAGSGGGGERTSPFGEAPAHAEKLFLPKDPANDTAWLWPQQQAATAHQEPPLSRAGSAWESMQQLPSCSSLEERPEESSGVLVASGSQHFLAPLQQEQPQQRTCSPSMLPSAAAGAPSYQSGAAVATAYHLEDHGGQLAGEAGGELSLRMVEELMGDTDLKDTLGMCDLVVPELPLLEPAQLDNDLLSLLDRPFSSCPLPSRQMLEAAASAQGQAWQHQQHQQNYHPQQHEQHHHQMGQVHEDSWLHHLPEPELALQHPSATVPLLHTAATAPSPFSSALPPAAGAPGWPSPVSSALPATSVAAVPSPFSSTMSAAPAAASAMASPASTALPAAAAPSPFASSMSAGPAGASPFSSALSAPAVGFAGASPFASTLPAAAVDLAAPLPYTDTLPAMATPAALEPLAQQQPIVPDFPASSHLASAPGHVDFGTAMSFPLAYQQQRQHYGQQQYQHERQYRSLQLLQQLQREQQQYLSHQRQQRQQLHQQLQHQQQQQQHVQPFTPPSSWDGYSSIDSSNSWPATGGLSVASLTTLHSWPLVEQQAGPGASEQQPQPGSQAAAGRQQEYLVRLSLKLFNVQPEELPDGVRQDVAGLIATDPALVATFVRPGCAHVTVMGLVGPVDHSRLLGLGAQGVARQLLESGGWLLPSAVAGGPGGQPRGQAWAEDMLVQLDDEVVVVKGGRLAHVVRTSSLAPQLLAARPVALLASPSHCEEATATLQQLAASPASTAVPIPAAAGKCGAAMEAGSGLLPAAPGVVTLWGYRISGSHDVVICRQQGRVLDLEILARGKLPRAARRSGAPEWVLVRPLAFGPGLLQFEVQRGGLLSQAVGVAALPTLRAVVEAKQAQRALAGAKGASQAFLQGLGLVVQQLQQQGLQQQPHPLLAALAARLHATARQHGWGALAKLLAPMAASAAAVSPVLAVTVTASVPALVAEPADVGGELARSAGKAPATQDAGTSGVPSAGVAAHDAVTGAAAALGDTEVLDLGSSAQTVAEGLPAQPGDTAPGVSSEGSASPAPVPAVTDGGKLSPPSSGCSGGSSSQFGPDFVLTADAGKHLCIRGVDENGRSSHDTISTVCGSQVSSLTTSQSVAECPKVGGDYAKWVAQQLSTVGPGGSTGLGSAPGAQFHACVAMLAAATGATLLLRNVLGEVQ